MNTKQIPKKNKEGDFYLPTFTESLLNRIEINNPILISGPSGCGKTELIENIAQEVGRDLYEIDFSVGVTEANIIGRFIVKDGATKFVYGVLPLAMMSGGWLLLDEIDFAEPEHLAVLQNVLTGRPLIVSQNESECITPHENFRIFATANTKGRGDETQSYAGTNVLNISFVDRFSIFEMDYTKKENYILKEYIEDEILNAKILEMFSLLRKATKDDIIINAVFSTRRLIQLAKALSIGETLRDAIKNEIVNRFENSEKPLINEYVEDIFNKDHYLKGWKIGDEHYVEPIENISIEENEAI